MTSKYKLILRLSHLSFILKKVLTDVMSRNLITYDVREFLTMSVHTFKHAFPSQIHQET